MERPGWVTELECVVADLEGMNRVTEGDFLRIGSQLMGFLSGARAIRTDFNQLAQSISGDAGERACEALTTVLSDSNETQRRLEKAAENLSELRRDAARVQQQFGGFDDIVLSFETVATLGRIETARLSGSHAELSHFSDEVRSCGARIHGRVLQGLKAASAMAKRIEGIIQYVSAADKKEIDALPSLLRTARDGLEAFRLRQKDAASGSAKLANDFGSFSDALNDLVAALQSHDITRQRIEHVVDALRSIVSKADAGGPASHPGPESLSVVHLQRHQLLGAGETFATSVKSINLRLEQIAMRARAMGEQTVTLFEAGADDQHTSFFRQMESRFAQVLNGVANCTTLTAQTGGALAELEAAVVSLTGCVQDIGLTTRDIYLLAINATIQAEHLGSAGAPLSEVARTLQSLHVEAREHTGNTRDSICELAKAVELLKQPAAGSEAGVLEELRARINELHESSDASLHWQQGISETASRLSSDVEAAARDFEVGALVQQTLARCCEVLEKIMSESGSRVTSDRRTLEDLSTQYTMALEREVHARATAAPLSRRPAIAVIPRESEPGDNVELF